MTIPLGPQLQAIWASPEGAKDLQYRNDIVDAALDEILRSEGNLPTFDDVFHGQDFIKAHHRGDIGPDDVVVMLSIDGAQLYESKKSDVWIYIWVVLDRTPEKTGTRKSTSCREALFQARITRRTRIRSSSRGFHHLAGIAEGRSEGVECPHRQDYHVASFQRPQYRGRARANSPRWPCGTFWGVWLSHLLSSQGATQTRGHILLSSAS